MGLKNFFKSIKPSKKKIELMQEQLEKGIVLRVDDGTDNKQIINEAEYNDSQQN